MATITFLRRSDNKNVGSVGSVIAYCVQEKKTQYMNVRLISGINCLPETAMQDFVSTKKRWNKTDCVQFYHAVQSFGNGETVNPYLAHSMAREWAERCYPDHEILIATHTDTDNIHSHIIINSVNMNTGYKIHQNGNDIKDMRKVNDEICLKYGLSVCVPKKKPEIKRTKPKEYYAARSGESWKKKMYFAVCEAMKYATCREHFIAEMEQRGYSVKWTDSRKNITFTETQNPSHRCRDDNLHDEKFLKERLTNEFRLRKRIEEMLREQSLAADNQNDDESDRVHAGQRRPMESAAEVYGVSEPLYEQYGGSAEDYGQRGNSREAWRRSHLFVRRYVEQGEGFAGGYLILGGERCSLEDICARLGFEETGWSPERRIFFGVEEDGGHDFLPQKEADSASDWNSNSRPSVISDSLYYIGNLSQMIDNQKHKPHRKHARLSQKEKEKKLAHGQKIEDDGWEQTI